VKCRVQSNGLYFTMGRPHGCVQSDCLGRNEVGMLQYIVSDRVGA
jgi:hypothetical protein